MGSEEAERSAISCSIVTQRVEGSGDIEKVYTEEDFRRRLDIIGMTEDELVNLNLCNNFLLLSLADFFEIPRQIMCTAMSLCQRFCVQSTGIFDRFNLVVGSFHLALKNHSYLLHIKEITHVALHLEYKESEIEGFLQQEMFKSIKLKIEMAQLDILKANRYNANSSAYQQVKVTTCLLINKKLWNPGSDTLKEFLEDALRLLLWSYGSKVVLMLPQNLLALVIICMALKGRDLSVPLYQGVPIWYYAGLSKDHMLSIVTELVDFYRINWAASETKSFDWDGFISVLTEEIESFQEPGSETRVEDQQGREEQWNDEVHNAAVDPALNDMEQGGQEAGDAKLQANGAGPSIAQGSPAGGDAPEAQAVEEGEIADQ